MDRMPASSSAPLAKSASGRLPYVWTTISLMSCIAVLYARDERERSVGPLSFHLAAFRFIICSVTYFLGSLCQGAVQFVKQCVEIFSCEPPLERFSDSLVVPFEGE